MTDGIEEGRSVVGNKLGARLAITVGGELAAIEGDSDSWLGVELATTVGTFDATSDGDELDAIDGIDEAASEGFELIAIEGEPLATADGD